jgi:hypothetical protein
LERPKQVRGVASPSKALDHDRFGHARAWNARVRIEGILPGLARVKGLEPSTSGVTGLEFLKGNQPIIRHLMTPKTLQKRLQLENIIHPATTAS